MEPYCRCRIDAVAAGDLLEDDLSYAGQQRGAEQHEYMPPRTGALSRVEYIGGRTTPCKVLDKFKKSGKGRRTDPCSDSSQQDRQPKVRGTGTLKCGRYVVTRGYWRGFGHRDGGGNFLPIGSARLAPDRFA